MNHLDIDFPEDLSNCFCGGLEFSTTISTTTGKKEIRNRNWNEGRYKYNLLYKNCNESTYKNLQAFFLLCGGSQKSFNFTDKNDNKIETQLLTNGDGHTKSFKIFKTYTYHNLSIKRNVFKVKNVKIYFNANEIDGSKYSITNNIITFTDDNIPQESDNIYIDCNFYVIVRFATDFLPVVRKSNNLIELPDITLIEVQK